MSLHSLRLRRAMPAALAFALALASALGGPVGRVQPARAASVVTMVAGGYTNPLYVTNTGVAGDTRLFIVERTGKIKIWDTATSASLGTFLDVGSLITAAGGEQGVLGMAFHPNYASNGLFYLDYTRLLDGATVIAEFHVNATHPNRADLSSKRKVIRIAQPYKGHNGGWIGFKGSHLFIALGDGGWGTDQVPDKYNRAQSKSSLLGKILRINPLKSGSASYTVPSTNPFVGVTGARPEIWSRGMRNPFRCSHDSVTGYLWCGDAGQGSYEEVDREGTGKGKNFGWVQLEGFHYFRSPYGAQGNVCTSHCHTLPILEYAHDAFGGGNCVVIGGYVDRRNGAPLNGKYIFGDYCSGNIWTVGAGFTRGTALPAPVGNTGFLISSFGRGADGRIYVCDYTNGAVYVLTDS